MGYMKTFPEQGCSRLTTTVKKKRQRSERENAAFLQTKKKQNLLKMGCFSVTAKMFY